MRKALFKWHSWAALFAMLPLFVVSITGSILVFKVEIDTWLMPEKMLVSTDQASARVSIDKMIDSINQTYQDYEVAGWELFDDHSRTDAAYLIKHNTHDWYKLYIDQYSGALLSSPVPMQHYITDWLLELHYAFLLDASGMFVGAIISLLLLFLGISGIILYRHFWRHLLQLRWTQARRILFSDMHKFIGIFSSPVLIILAFTGAYWNLLMVAHELEDHVLTEPYVITAPLYKPETISVQDIVDRSQQDISGFNPTYLLIPFEPELDFMVFGEVPNAGVLASEYSSVLTYNKSTGELSNTVDIRDAGLGHQIDDSFRKLHFGYFGGIVSKIIWSVLGLSPVWLSLTGLYLYLFRRRRWGRAS